MKILHIEDRFHPSIGYQLNFIARYHNIENEMIILSSFHAFSGQDQNYDKLLQADREFEIENNVKIIRLQTLYHKNNKNNILLKGLKKTIKQINPDLIFIHGIETYTAFMVFSDKSILKKYKVVSDTHTLYNQFSNSIKFKLYLWILKKIVVSNVNKFNIPVFYTAIENMQILKKEYGVNHNLIYSFEIGTDPTIYFQDIKEGSQLKQKLNIKDNDIVLLYVGKFNKNKQPHLILQAIKQIEGQINSTSIKLLFIGTKDEKYFESFMLPIRFDSNLIEIIYIPFIKNTELYKYYSMADFAIFPKENTLSALDVQACGLPVIMEKDLTNAERLKFGGLLYNKDSIKDLGNKILNLINDKQLRTKLSQEGQKYIIENYNYEKIISNMEHILINYQLRPNN
jgi:glycosyltransferase involved in cell wall biosynthesis